MTSIATRRDQLTARLGELQARMTRIEAELSAPHSADWEDLAAEHDGDEVLSSIGLTDQQESRMIEAALHRIEEGSYGLCTRCGETIAERRLDVLPFTPLCHACAAQTGA